MSRRARPATVACTPSRSSAGSRARGEVPTDFFERITGYAGPTQRYERPARFRLGFRGCGWNKNAGSATVTALFQPHRQGILRQAGAYLISRGRSTLSVRCSRRGDVADALRRPRRTCVFFRHRWHPWARKAASADPRIGALEAPSKRVSVRRGVSRSTIWLQTCLWRRSRGDDAYGASPRNPLRRRWTCARASSSIASLDSD